MSVSPSSSPIMPIPSLPFEDPRVQMEQIFGKQDWIFKSFGSGYSSEIAQEEFAIGQVVGKQKARLEPGLNLDLMSEVEKKMFHFDKLFQIEMQARFALHHLKMANLKRELFLDIAGKVVPAKNSDSGKKKPLGKGTLKTLPVKKVNPRFSVVDTRLMSDSAQLEQQMIRQQLSLYPATLSLEPKR
jgi:hypothetical protein